MVFSLKKIYEQFIQPAAGKTEKFSEHAIQVATAALLIEVMKADGKVSGDERTAVMQTMQAKFNLTDEETKSLNELAKEKIRKATDNSEFTSLIHKGLSYEQKVEVIEHLWGIALTDKHLDKHEEYVVRKIADLIYVEHKEFIEAKLKIKSRI